MIIPVFERYRSVQSAIHSAASQLGPDDEILVVDDASNPPLVLDERPSGPGRIDVLRSALNRGAASARNIGLSEAGGAWVAFLDSDDLWLPGKIAAQVEQLARSNRPLTGIACGWQETQAGRVVRTRLPIATPRRSDFFAGCWHCPGSTLLIPREAFRICGDFAEGLRRLEDFEWFLRFAAAGGELVVAQGIGASIARGGNARPAAVEAAATVVAHTLDRLDATASERRDCQAYLDLERAAALRNTGQTAAMAAMLARSFAARPRLSVPLRRWWVPAPGD
ncbi:glycosyltransferase [Aurantimonas sp. MSK8Z-1]|uniref:glycosyltransferase family 2 protein n=1 Tax=Mangrovibrevibacter kandeliae TaxID=2968473 RepID=UPI002118099B|nr:glycosyltransferase family 2 protein [Aurantimonas sp. MSK8Z-1]MCW4116997.1 glycosyltransferase [Aurantimonas sp. MSK8Z-1]